MVRTPTKGSVTVYIDAPPDQLYDMVSDVTRMGEWSPQTFECTWLDGATGPAVGARFQARNRRGRMTWKNEPQVVTADPGREFAFRRKAYGSDVVWGYRFEASGDGTEVTEWYDVIKPPRRPMMWLFSRLNGVRDYDADMQHNARLTLNRLKTAVAARA